MSGKGSLLKYARGEMLLIWGKGRGWAQWVGGAGESMWQVAWMLGPGALGLPGTNRAPPASALACPSG